MGCAKRGLRFLLPDEARIYINRHIKPHLIADIPGALVAHLEVSWRPRDVLRVTMSELHDVPSWLLSNGGSGLIEHIGKCMDIDADQGKNESIFELHPLPNNPDRWGDNTMTKFTHGSQPIGVSPFPPGVFAKVMGLIGFTATVDTTPESVVLTLRW